MATLSGPARQHLIDNSGKVSKTAFKVTIWVFFVFAVLCTLTRCAVRGFTPRRLSLGDYFVLLATAALAATLGVLLKILDDLYIAEALNDHPGKVSVTFAELPGLLAVSKWSKIMVVMVWLSIFAIKAAFLSFLHILIRQLSRKINIYFWIVAGFNTGCWLALAFIDWAICPYVDEKAIQCDLHFDYGVSLAVNTVSAVLDIICDIMIISVPILVLSRSLMSISQKVSYSGILCLSVFMIVAALIRLIGSVATTHKTNHGTAPIWGTFWEIIEACVAVIMASFLTFRSFFAKNSTVDPAGAAPHPNRNIHRPGTLWERLLSTLRFRSRYRKSPSITAEEGKVDVHQGNRDGLAGRKVKDHLISTAAITRPTLVFSRLQTLFRTESESEATREGALIHGGTIDVVTEFDLRELDYHQILREEASSSAGINSIRTEIYGRNGESLR
ncbi:hypothetical protein VPNG_05787 [Cytospora leucostoma]|uniref:Rhodopsin domain-containing protein n=1 Tax=Cytospora leucostoma TaxID=1230097 RepID=A0A423X0Q2_9PEZI|nr:hypothetical protein VPNG_05787 [Cytospora leucostoma]